MDVTALADREHDNLLVTFELFGAHVTGAAIGRAGGVATVLTGLPLRLFNQVLIEDASATPDAISSAIDVARRRGDRFVLGLRVGVDDRFIEVARDLGLVPLSDEPWMPGMALHPLPVDHRPDGRDHAIGGLDIREVADADGLADHMETLATGFEIPITWIRSVMGLALIKRPDVFAYVGYLDDEPVTTGLGLRTGDTIGIYNIATVPSARKRGYGEAMTRRIAAGWRRRRVRCRDPAGERHGHADLRATRLPHRRHATWATSTRRRSRHRPSDGAPRRRPRRGRQFGRATTLAGSLTFEMSIVRFLPTAPKSVAMNDTR